MVTITITSSTSSSTPSLKLRPTCPSSPSTTTRIPMILHHHHHLNSLVHAVALASLDEEQLRLPGKTWTAVCSKRLPHLCQVVTTNQQSMRFLLTNMMIFKQTIMIYHKLQKRLPCVLGTLHHSRRKCPRCHD